MVGIVAAVGGQVEGDRQALLPGREVAAVEGVGVLGRGEAGVLADRPGLVDVHGRVGAAQVGRQARPGVEEVEPGQIRRAVGALHRNALGRQPRLARRRDGRQGGVRERNAGEIGNAAHVRASLWRVLCGQRRLRRQRCRPARRSAPPARAGRPMLFDRIMQDGATGSRGQPRGRRPASPCCSGARQRPAAPAAEPGRPAAGPIAGDRSAR